MAVHCPLPSAVHAETEKKPELAISWILIAEYMPKKFRITVLRICSRCCSRFIPIFSVQDAITYIFYAIPNMDISENYS